ncbi:MAG: ABC transporter permease [Dehalococcoidia bacterium]|nr:ABC transporter permease [Dehalococcoidia bacterium]
MSMHKYVISRLIDSISTLFLIIIVNFVLFRIMPGDPLKFMVRSHRLSAEATANLEELYGLTKPMWEQFFIYIKNLFIFQFGTSFLYKSPATPLILEKMWNSILLLLASTILAMIIGTLLGLVAGWFHGKPVDFSLITTSLFFWCMPTFWIAMVFAAAFVTVLPISGMHTLTLYNASWFVRLLDLGKHIMLPTIVLTLLYIGEMLILARNEVSNILTQDYISTARAKGLAPRQIIFRHILRNASLPLVSTAGMSLAFLVGGALQTEIIFSWPGIGRLMYTATLARDYAILQGSFYILSFTVLIANFLTDITYKYLDPRVEY